jgi:hypothetical protein
MTEDRPGLEVSNIKGIVRHAIADLCDRLTGSPPNWRRRRPPAILGGSREEIVAVAFSPDGNTVLASFEEEFGPTSRHNVVSGISGWWARRSDISHTLPGFGWTVPEPRPATRPPSPWPLVPFRFHTCLPV